MKRFIEKIRNKKKYPRIRIKEGQNFPGVDVVFFERCGGVSKNRRTANKKLIGLYASLNVFTVAKRIFPEGSQEQREYMRAVAENICRAADYIGTNLKQLTVLESRYGKGDDPHIVNAKRLEETAFYEEILPEIPGVEAVKIRKRSGDVIMTDDPNTPIAIVGADAHPIAIKALKPDGRPVVCLVVGSHQGLLQYGVMQKAIDAMSETYDIVKDTVRIDIGPGLCPMSIDDYSPDKGDLSSTSYEVGMDLAQRYMRESKDAKSPYCGRGLKFFDAKELSRENFKTDEEYIEYAALAGSEGRGRPIFRKHPFNAEKCVIDIEALARQTAEVSGIDPDSIVAVGEGKYFSARGMVKKLDLNALARSHARVLEEAQKKGITPEEFIAKPESAIYRNDGMGRNIFIAKILDVLPDEKIDAPPVSPQIQVLVPRPSAAVTAGAAEALCL